jgi:hypothetical protein
MSGPFTLLAGPSAGHSSTGQWVLSRSPERTRFQGGLRCDTTDGRQGEVVQVQAVHSAHGSKSPLHTSVHR